MIKINKSEWLDKAIVFDLGSCHLYNRPILIEARMQIDGSKKWVLKMHEWVLGKDGEFHYEPTPSNRSSEYILNTRFDNPFDCYIFWTENIKSTKPLPFNF